MLGRCGGCHFGRFSGSGLCRKPRGSPFCGLGAGLGARVCWVGVGAAILADSVGRGCAVRSSPFCGLAVGLGARVCWVGVGAAILADSVGRGCAACGSPCGLAGGLGARVCWVGVGAAILADSVGRGCAVSLVAGCGLAGGLGARACCVGVGADSLADSVGRGIAARPLAAVFLASLLVYGSGGFRESPILFVCARGGGQYVHASGCRETPLMHGIE